MRNCPFTGCKKLLPDSKFACPRHWYILSRSQQDEIWDAYSMYLRDEITIHQLRERQQIVIDAVEGRM